MQRNINSKQLAILHRQLTAKLQYLTNLRLRLNRCKWDDDEPIVRQAGAAWEATRALAETVEAERAQLVAFEQQKMEGHRRYAQVMRGELG